MSQEDCNYCGGLHYGSPRGMCVYICAKCKCDIRPDAVPKCACPPAEPSMTPIPPISRFNLGSEPSDYPGYPDKVRMYEEESGAENTRLIEQKNVQVEAYKLLEERMERMSAQLEEFIAIDALGYQKEKLRTIIQKTGTIQTPSEPFYGNSECADCGRSLGNWCYWVPVNKDDEGEGSEKAICPECYCRLMGGSDHGPVTPDRGVPPPASRQLRHAMNCGAGYNAHGDEIDAEDCRCGLRYRIQLQTEQTMHAAWRKRAEEAEERIAKLTAERDTLQEMGTTMSVQIGRYQVQIANLEAENTRLKAPVSNHELREHFFEADSGGFFLCNLESVDKLITDRATRTPPQEGQ